MINTTNVLLINPPSPYLENAASYPPMGLMHVASDFERGGCNVRILDLALKKYWKGSLIQNFAESDVDLVGITCVTPNVPVVKDIVSIIPSSVPTMVGGIHPTILPDETLAETGCTFVVKGEIERLSPLILNDIETEVLQKIYWGGVTKAEFIGKPARHLVNLHDYHPGGDAATPIYTSRGCPYSCSFCSKISQTGYREIPLSQVVEEVEEVISLGFRKVVFGDDNIGLNTKRLYRLLEMLDTLDIQFRLNMDARHPDSPVLQTAQKSGCTDISFGIESGSQTILNAMNKQTTVERNALAIRMTQDACMEAKAYFMVNFPGETEQTVKETLKFAEETRPDKWLLSAFAPLPGSEVYRNPIKYGITSLSKDWSDYYLVGKDGRFNPCFTTDYLTYYRQEELHDMMYNGLKEVLG